MSVLLQFTSYDKPKPQIYRVWAYPFFMYSRSIYLEILSMISIPYTVNELPVTMAKGSRTLIIESIGYVQRVPLFHLAR